MFEPFFISPEVFKIIFLIIIGVIAFKIMKGVKEWQHNNKQPVLTVASTVITKRVKNSRHIHHHVGNHHHHVTSDYFATFEVESGDRLEMQLTGKEYDQIAEGDVGELTFQGTRFLDFKRITK